MGSNVGGVSGRGEAAVVMSGGGARSAYQVGVLRGLARHLPDFRFPIVVGVSAGAINSAFFAAHPGGLREAADELAALWVHLRVEDVFRLDTSSLARSLLGWLRWSSRLPSGPPSPGPEV